MIEKHPRRKNPRLLTKMKKEIGHCERCGGIHCLEAAHIERKGMGGGSGPDIPENVVILDGPAAFLQRCHGLDHQGLIPKDELYAIAAKREGISVDECKRRVRMAMGKPVDNVS